jgi:hypothetical protein
VSAEASLEGSEVDGTVMLVDLHGVAAAEGDVGAILTGEVDEDALGTYWAVGAWGPGGNLGAVDFAVIGWAPEVEGEQGATHKVRLTGKELEGLGDLDGGGEIDCGGEDSGGVTGLDVAGGRLGEDAGEAGSGGNR